MHDFSAHRLQYRSAWQSRGIAATMKVKVPAAADVAGHRASTI